MKKSLITSSLVALLASGNLMAGEPASSEAAQAVAASKSMDLNDAFDTGYGYRRGGYGYPYGRGRGYGRGGGYGYRGRGCY